LTDLIEVDGVRLRVSVEGKGSQDAPRTSILE